MWAYNVTLSVKAKPQVTLATASLCFVAVGSDRKVMGGYSMCF